MITQNTSDREQASKKAIHLLNFFEKQHGLVPKVLSVDNELNTILFEEYAMKKGWDVIFTTPDQSYQNGVAERGNRTLAGLTKANLTDTDVPKKLWSFAVIKSTKEWNSSPKEKLN